MPKTLTREQLQSRKDKAVRFTRDVLGKPERAEEIAEESLEDYAARRKITITNPMRKEKWGYGYVTSLRCEFLNNLTVLCGSKGQEQRWRKEADSGGGEIANTKAGEAV